MMSGSFIRCLVVAFVASAALQDNLVAAVQVQCFNVIVKCADPLSRIDSSGNKNVGDHCNAARQTLTCLQVHIGKYKCPRLNDNEAKMWKQVNAPIYEDVLKYVCETKLKEFSIHAACLLTRKITPEFTHNCPVVGFFSSMTWFVEDSLEVLRDPKAIECVGGVVKKECGDAASEFVKTLMETVIKRPAAAAEDLKELDQRVEDGGEVDDLDEK